jgi:hypothetical protein
LLFYAHKIIFIKPEGKRSFTRPKHGLKDNIKMDFEEMGWMDSWGSGW